MLDLQQGNEHERSEVVNRHLGKLKKTKTNRKMITVAQTSWLSFDPPQFLQFSCIMRDLYILGGLSGHLTACLFPSMLPCCQTTAITLGECTTILTDGDYGQEFSFKRMNGWKERQWKIRSLMINGPHE